MNYSNCLREEGLENRSIWLAVFSTFIFAFSLICNLCAIPILLSAKSTGSIRVYLFNLIFVELLSTIVLSIRIYYYYSLFDWKLGEVMCRITTFLFHTSIYAIINFVSCISIDRYYAISIPHIYKSYRYIRNAKIICCVVWLVVLLQSVPILFISTSTSLDGNITVCMEYHQVSVYSLGIIHFMIIITCIISFAVASTIMVVSYLSVFRIILYQSSNGYRLGLSSRTCRVWSSTVWRCCKRIICTLTVFTLCFLPYHTCVVFYIIYITQYSTLSCLFISNFNFILHTTACLTNLSCCIDPFIYVFACGDYRKIRASIKLIIK